MSALLPGPKGPLTRMRVTLSGATYGVEWRWNDRDGAWYFSMEDPSGEPLVSGIRCVLGVDLLGSVPVTDRRPPYGLWVFDPSEGMAEPTYESFGKSVLIYYPEPDE